MHDKKHKSMEKFNDICELKHQLLHYVMGEVGSGLEGDPSKVSILGAYVDMIKDLAEAEKSCQEACYYESVVAAMDEYGDNPRMGYNPNRNAMGQYSDGRGRSGDSDSYQGGSGNRRSGYTPDWHMMEQDRPRPGEEGMDYDERYGKPFNEFRKAKRHYTKTHSPEDKEKMKEHANEHVMETMTTIREIYDNADPDLKKRMKADLSKLVGEMTV